MAGQPTPPNHWFPLIRPYLTLISAVFGYVARGGGPVDWRSPSSSGSTVCCLQLHRQGFSYIQMWPHIWQTGLLKMKMDTPLKINMEPKNVALVQMFFLFNWVMFVGSMLFFLVCGVLLFPPQSWLVENGYLQDVFPFI